jgi:hypothetical protein
MATFYFIIIVICSIILVTIIKQFLHIKSNPVDREINTLYVDLKEINKFRIKKQDQFDNFVKETNRNN